MSSIKYFYFIVSICMHLNCCTLSSLFYLSLWSFNTCGESFSFLYFLSFFLATEVVTVFVFQEPSLLSSLQDNGLTDVMLHALLIKDVSPFCCFVKSIFCLFLLLFRAAPLAYGGFQARGPIKAIAATLHHSHSNTGSEMHLQPTPQLMATPDP